MLLCRLWQTPQGRESLSPFPSEPFPISWLQQVLAARCRESVCDVWAAVHFFLCGPTTLLGAAYNTKRESRKVEKRRKAAASPKMVPVRALRQAAAPALLIPVVGKIIWRAIEHSRPRPIPLRCFEPLLQAPSCPEAHEPTRHASLKFASTSHSSWKSPIIAKSSCLTQHVYLNEVDLVEDHSS